MSIGNIVDKINKSVISGMPGHPIMKDKTVLWEDPGDYWLFKKTTNNLVPKVVQRVGPNDPQVRYTAVAIKRALVNGGGSDFVIWQETEERVEQSNVAVVVPILCFGPSHMEHEADIESTVDAVMIAFKQVYVDPEWNVVYESPEYLKAIGKLSDG